MGYVNFVAATSAENSKYTRLNLVLNCIRKKKETLNVLFIWGIKSPKWGNRAVKCGENFPVY